MLTPLTIEIRDHVRDYLAGTLSFHAFQDWLVGATWDVESLDDPAATALTYSIKLSFAEHAAGDISEDQLRGDLEAFVPRVTTITLDAAAWGMAWRGATSASSGSVREEAPARLASVFGEPRVVGSW